MPTSTLALLLEFPTVTPRPMLDLKDANLREHEDVELARVTRSNPAMFFVVMFYICGNLPSDSVHLNVKNHYNKHPMKRSFVLIK